MSKMIVIAFANGGIIPAAITGGEPKSISPHQPVEVPEQYGQQLITDRFAVLASKKPASKKTGNTDKNSNAAHLAELGKAYQAAKDNLAKATDETRDALQSEFDLASDALEKAKG